MPPDLNDDDGFLDVSVTVAGTPRAARLDLYAAAGDLADLYHAHDGGKAPGYWPAVAAWAAAAGLPAGLSRRTLEAVTTGVFARADQMRKKDAGAGASASPG